MPYMENARHVAQNPAFLRHQGPPKVYATTDLKINLFRLAQQGYLLVGYSLAPAECGNLDQAKQTAQEIGAAIVLIQTRDAKLRGVLDAYPSPLWPGRRPSNSRCSPKPWTGNRSPRSEAS